MKINLFQVVLHLKDMTYPAIRTPEERFVNLHNYPFQANYIEIQGYRIHYIDESQGPTILLLHGEPSWSYLYRKMIPPLIEKGYRVIAPDLLGFGKSDKLINRKHYSYQLLVDLMTEFVDKLDLNIDAMFIQDWGSLIGFRLMETVGHRIQRVLVANGAFPSASGWKGWLGHSLFKFDIWRRGKVSQEKLTSNLNFANWVAFAQTVDNFPVGDTIQRATVIELSKDEIESYNAPFPDETYKEGVRQLPMLVTSQLRKNHQVWETVLKTWKKPFLTLFGDNDPITRGNEKRMIKRIPGAQNIEHNILTDAAHFIQEDKPNELVAGIEYLLSYS